MHLITSKDNEMIKNVKKLTEKKYRDLNGEFIIEGIKMLREAIQEGAKIRFIVICEENVKAGEIDQKLLFEIAKYECIYVSKNIFDYMSNVKNPQGILAVIQKKNSEEEIDFKEDVQVVLDGIQDPGNLGTILRTIDSVGLKQVIVSKDTADAFNPKVVRSTMGAIFRIRIIESEHLLETLREFKKHKYQVMVTSLQTKTTIYDIDYHRKVLVIGNEANGVSKEVREYADQEITIPMLGKAESLNASVATGIILYEYVRNRLKK